MDRDTPDTRTAVHREASGRTAGRTAGPAPRAALWVGAGVVGLLLAAALAVGRDLWFFSDDWNILADYHRGNLLEPFNGHLSMLPAGVYQLLFHTAGLDSYLPYRLCGLVALAVLGFQVLRYARGRVGPWVAVVAVAAVMWNSYGTTNVMFPFLMNFSLPIAALVAIWWHLDRKTLADDVACGIWLAAALATSGLGVMTLGAVAVELAVKRESWRRWVAFVPATVLWLVWWVNHREANDMSTDFPRVASYALRMLWGGTTALAAGSQAGGLVLAAAFVALLVVGAIRWRSLDGRVLGALAAALAFAGLTAFTRLDVRPAIRPDELRYGWTIGAYFVLAAVAVWRPHAADRRLAAAPGAAWWRPAAFAVAAVVLLIGAVHLLDGMRSWSDQVAHAAPGLRSNLYAAEAAGNGRVGPDAVIRPLSFVPVTARSYLAAVADVGSPLQGSTGAQIGGRADQREAADQLYFTAAPPTVEDVPGDPPSPPPGRCATTVTVPPGSMTLLRRPAAGGTTGGAPLSAGDGRLLVTRFGRQPSRPLHLDVAGDVAVWVRVPRDARVGTSARVPLVMQAPPGTELCPGG